MVSQLGSQKLSGKAPGAGGESLGKPLASGRPDGALRWQGRCLRARGHASSFPASEALFYRCNMDSLLTPN